MKIELPALDSEPILYFLLHSGVFVGGISLLFFLLGVWMGATIWGRYKKQLAQARLAMGTQLAELAMLKRRLAELAVRPPTAPLAAAVPLLTEVLPDVGQVFPERKKQPPPAAAAGPAPAVQTSTLAATAIAPAAPEAGMNGLPALPAASQETPPASPEPPPPVVTGGLPLGDATFPRRPIIRVKRRMPMPPPLTPAVPATPDAAMNGAEPDSRPEPFSFLLGGGIQEPESTVPVSTLAAIVRGGAALPPLPDLPHLPELPALPDEPGPAGTLLVEDCPAPGFSMAEGETPVATPAPMAPSAEPFPPGLAAPALSVPLHFDQTLGLLYLQPPPDADDLTQIRGVSAVLAARLQELGVYTFRQIAGWDENQVREFSLRLAFKDRIDREQWVEQARALGEASAPATGAAPEFSPDTQSAP